MASTPTIFGVFFSFIDSSTTVSCTYRVSSCVLNEFIKSNGTSTPYRMLIVSTCRTVKSKNVRSSSTSKHDFGPRQPIVVPSPPFSLHTTTRSSNAWFNSTSSGTFSNASYCSSRSFEGGFTLDHFTEAS